jgi:hypothetical protein
MNEEECEKLKEQILNRDPHCIIDGDSLVKNKTADLDSETKWYEERRMAYFNEVVDELLQYNNNNNNNGSNGNNGSSGSN